MRRLPTETQPQQDHPASDPSVQKSASSHLRTRRLQRAVYGRTHHWERRRVAAERLARTGTPCAEKNITAFSGSAKARLRSAWIRSAIARTYPGRCIRPTRELVSRT